jgi:c-di-GMP-related signal transduction protein
VALNVSPQTIISGGIDGYIDDLDPHRVVLEITEHSLVEDYGLLNKRLVPLREAGVRVAVDDAGAGYASMRHVLAIHPDIIKLDLSLTRDIDTDSPRRALAAALIEFARQTQSSWRRCRRSGWTTCRVITLHVRWKPTPLRRCSLPKGCAPDAPQRSGMMPAPSCARRR